MGNRSARAHYRDGSRINERRHGTCAHQWVDLDPCLRCGQRRIVRFRTPGDLRSLMIKPTIKIEMQRAAQPPEPTTPAAVPKPLRRSLLQRFKGLFTPKGR